MKSLKIAVLLAAFALLAPAAARDVTTATPDDTARYLAGLPLPEASPVRALADGSWLGHVGYMNSAFERVEQRQLSKIRKWTSAHLNNARPTMFYMFGGPDFLYANAFYENANTYVLAGLEPVGPVPDVLALRGSASGALSNLRGSLQSILGVGYFITSHMSSNLNSGRLNGTLPVIYVFLARSGKTIQSVNLINLDDKGEVREGDGTGVKTGARGAKIVFTDKQGRTKTLYYFSTNLADNSFKVSGFAKFLDGLGVGDSLVKSASYLLHSSEFSQVREFLLSRSATILQDDTGIPADRFDGKRWQLSVYGNYVGPISIFRDRYQPRLAELYRKQPTRPLEFSIGYHATPDRSNMLMATRTDLQSEQ